MNNRLLAAGGALLLATSLAQAVEFRQTPSSENRVGFAYTQMGVPMEGTFSRFKREITFDPAHPEQAHARIDLDLAGIDTGSGEANEAVSDQAWFDTAHFPTAHFVSASLNALGGNRYEAGGKLTLKGQTRAVRVPLTFHAEGRHGTFDGALTIRRLDYGIGTGAWADVSAVADEVRITFHFVVQSAAQPQPSKGVKP